MRDVQKDVHIDVRLDVHLDIYMDVDYKGHCRIQAFHADPFFLRLHMRKGWKHAKSGAQQMSHG